MSLSIDADRITAGRRSDTYLAMRSVQGGRVVYSTRVPLLDLDKILPVPNPNQTDPDNRKVNTRHAKSFGDYMTTHQNWVAPTLLARDNGGCTFQPLDDGDHRVGYLNIPWATGSVGALSTIDGQHRILGTRLETQRLSEEINKVERDLTRTRSENRIATLRTKLERLRASLDRLQQEAIGLDIYVEPDSVQARQMFVDVADNAKGISTALRARFDGSKIVNRTLDRVIDHALLKGRVDLEQDRMTRNSVNLLGAKHVADLTKAVAVGVGGRVSKRRESELSDEAVVEEVHGFLDSITTAFPDLADVADGTLTPTDLRSRSLLGSVGMLRVLAGTYRALREKDVAENDIAAFFTTLAPHMAAPVPDDGIWRRTEAGRDFEQAASAPVMRTQNLQHLATVVTSWYPNAPRA
ncbi:DndB-like DNA-sulfur modification-associated protein [Halopolyspora algeriensis]|uniref:DndB-like DNA-sulfur modification-associated protein n=1 Tax=Halopolyspora algeriensis TaxID=1500506 RepID=A0A368VUS8_9ACTN|nr:DNA sulfur modification protein DndB [Halopolyspora algeriensis]RCW45854.1 DndB-like DNA-sulfur modification-associated protein [Halopolyspora algeriensis]TQM55269.1 DndB-like DNA-sulfur modification-associated protein [Halopolyspora algeriensis]